MATFDTRETVPLMDSGSGDGRYTRSRLHYSDRPGDRHLDPTATATTVVDEFSGEPRPLFLPPGRSPFEPTTKKKHAAEEKT